MEKKVNSPSSMSSITFDKGHFNVCFEAKGTECLTLQLKRLQKK